MRITILDTRTLTGDDLDWSALESLGEIDVYDHTPLEQVVARAREAEVILTNKIPLDAAVMEQLPQLRYIGVTATGYDMIDLAAARARGIVVTNAAGYGTQAVAQHVFALLLAMTNRVALHAADVRAGGWQAQDSWTYRLTPLHELQGLRLGILGLGRIGRATAQLGQAFGMEVLGHSRTRRELPGITWMASSQALAARSQVLSLHCPLTDATEGMIDAEFLAQLPAGAYLINTARGGLIREADLAAALRSGQLGGAGLDVLSQEPPPEDHPLLGLETCLITPHLAWGARASRQRLLQQVVANLAAWQAGDPIHVVS
jgi:glycerate dehydrogenase